MSKRNSFVKILLLAILLLASISCNLVNLGQEETPTPVPPPAQNPLPESSGAAFTYSLTENELNQYATVALQDNPDSYITDLAITLPDGLIDISGQVEQPPLKAQLHLLARPYVDGNGNIKVEVVEADLGPIPIGQEMLNTIAAYLEDLLKTSLDPVSGEYQIDSILITGQVLTISGHQR